MINSMALDLFRSGLQADLKEMFKPNTSCWMSREVTVIKWPLLRTVGSQVTQ